MGRGLIPISAMDTKIWGRSNPLWKMTYDLHKTYIDLLVHFKITARCWTRPSTMEMLCKSGFMLYYLKTTRQKSVCGQYSYTPPTDNLFLVRILNIQQIGSAVLFSPIPQKQNWEDSEVQQLKLGTEPRHPNHSLPGQRNWAICLWDLTVPPLHSSERLSFVFLLWI